MLVFKLKPNFNFLKRRKAFVLFSHASKPISKSEILFGGRAVGVPF